MDIQPTPQSIDRALEAIKEGNRTPHYTDQRHGGVIYFPNNTSVFLQGDDYAAFLTAIETCETEEDEINIMGEYSTVAEPNEVEPPEDIDIYADNHPRWDGD